MKKDLIKEQYNRIYGDLAFDRALLFEAIKKTYGCTQIIYPGCGIHITPSFYFQHVVYIDLSETAQAFFENVGEVLNFIETRKRYPQEAYIRFLNLDFTLSLPIRQNEYDLLIALYADNITTTCTQYVRPGGLILTNNFHGDAVQGLKDSTLSLEACMHRKGKAYVISPCADDDIPQNSRALQDRANLVNTGRGLIFRDSGRYYLLRKNRQV